MEINLIPEEPFVIKHYKKLLLLVFFVWLLVSMAITRYIIQQDQIIADLEERVAVLKEEKNELELYIEHNRAALAREEELKDFRKYKALIDGIEASLIPSWSYLLDEIAYALPPHAVLLSLEGEGNRLNGTAAVYSLSEMAYFLNDIESLDVIDQASARVVQRAELYDQYIFDPEQVKMIEFTLYTNQTQRWERGSEG